MSDLVTRAALALREQSGGSSPHAASTRRRLLSEARRRVRRRRALLTIWMPIAAVLVVSSAWAAATGRSALLLSLFRKAPSAAVLAKRPAQVATAPERNAEAVAPPASPSSASSPSPGEGPADAPPVAPVAGTRKPGRAVAAAPSDPEVDLYSAAHRAHFVTRDSQLALSAWDEYLKVYPHGRFAPEARYNRALALVRLGRVNEAREALAPFADGRSDGYRQAEARSLLGALDAGR